jgi:hypothetical protein
LTQVAVTQVHVTRGSTQPELDAMLARMKNLGWKNLEVEVTQEPDDFLWTAKGVFLGKKFYGLSFSSSVSALYDLRDAVWENNQTNWFFKLLFRVTRFFAPHEHYYSRYGL